MKSTITLDAAGIEGAVAVRDLTDPAGGPHAMQAMVRAIRGALEGPVRDLAGPRVVTLAANYHDLLFPREGVKYDAFFASSDTILRTHVSCLVPRALRELAEDRSWRSVVLFAPGVVYRRDRIGPYHAREPHQVDVWWLTRGGHCSIEALTAAVDGVLAAALPSHRWRYVETFHPYTTAGRRIDVLRDDGSVLELAECGINDPRLLASCGHGPDVTAMSMGLGLDRAFMLRKGIDDIRVLRSDDPRITEQMSDLAPYAPPPTMEPMERIVEARVDGEVMEDEAGDLVRAALGPRAGAIAALVPTPDTLEAATSHTEGDKTLRFRCVVRDLSERLDDEAIDALVRDATNALARG